MAKVLSILKTSAIGAVVGGVFGVSKMCFGKFLNGLLDRFCANLTPTWLQKPSPHEAKLASKSIKNCINILINFLMDF